MNVVRREPAGWPSSLRVAAAPALIFISTTERSTSTRSCVTRATPRGFLSRYDSGDHLHPGDAGYQAMANALDLGLFTINQPTSASRSTRRSTWDASDNGALDEEVSSYERAGIGASAADSAENEPERTERDGLIGHFRHCGGEQIYDTFSYRHQRSAA